MSADNQPVSCAAIASRETGSSADKWVRAEAIAKIVSLIAIPVILAIVGWLVQDKLATSTVSKDYVQLAVSILSQPKQADIDPALRSWAVELLNHNSPVKFSTEIARQLQSGRATLPIEQSENLQALGELYLKSGNYAKAEVLLLEALALQVKLLGGDHPAVADSLANLGTLYLALGNSRQAEAMFQQALQIQEKIGSSANVARLLTDLAAVYDARGDSVKAQTFRHRAGDIYRKLGVLDQK